MIPKRSYLLNAAYSWVADNEMTPYLLVDAEQENVVVPTEFVKDGQIVLNISMSAVRHLIMDKDAVSFEALYAKENGDGFVFPDEEFEQEPTPTPPTPPKGFQLKVVK